MCKESPNSSFWTSPIDDSARVEDMVLNLDNTQVAYVVVGTGGFLDLGEREILVHWESLDYKPRLSAVSKMPLFCKVMWGVPKRVG